MAMDTESVIEFLGCVPLLQRLPGSSLREIAQLVIVKHYDRGDYVAREGEPVDGIYLVWDGEAEVIGPERVDDENRPEFQLKRYDYFGHGTRASLQQFDVIAMSKLTCLMLPDKYLGLLQSKSIWNADRTHDMCALVEHILHLEPLEVNIFRGITLPDTPNYGKVFGGQFIGQALATASKTVDCLKFAHSLHACFLLAGDLHLPIIYQVHRIRDGKSFATRRVEATQKGRCVFSLFASFQKEEEGFDHQEVAVPLVSDPEMLLSMEELRERRITDPRLPRTYRNKVATANFVPWPIDIRFCEPNTSTNQTKSPPSLRYWFRAKGKLSDDQALHRCVVAYASDLIFLQVSLNPHRKRGLKPTSTSLDHAMWFHRPCKADEWLLFVMESPTAFNARGFCSGQMFNQKGELVVSLTQEGLLRKAKNPPPASASAVPSKL